MKKMITLNEECQSCSGSRYPGQVYIGKGWTKCDGCGGFGKKYFPSSSLDQVIVKLEKRLEQTQKRYINSEPERIQELRYALRLLKRLK